MEALLGHRRAIVAAVLCISFILSAPAQPTSAQIVSQSLDSQISPASATSQSELQPAVQGFGQFRPSTGFQPAGFSRSAKNGTIKNAYKVEAGRLDATNSGLDLAKPIGVFRGQDFQTRNFYVQAGNAGLAKAVGEAAEGFRRELAIQWLGHELPSWDQPCPIQVNISNQAHGETSFLLPEYGSGMPSDWEMKIYGPVDRLLDSVLPHEVTHTIFATHFKQRLPRWVDEGACTMVEHESEKQKIHSMLLQYLSPRMGKGLPFNDMFVMRDYPVDHHGMLALYAQGFSVSKYLIAQGGYEHFGRFIKSGLDHENQTNGDRNSSIAAWTKAVDQYYHFESLSDLQIAWLDWVQDGSQELEATARYESINGREAVALASANMPESQVPAMWTNQSNLPRPSTPRPGTPRPGTLRGTEDSVGNLGSSNPVPQGSNTNIYQRLANGLPAVDRRETNTENVQHVPATFRLPNQADAAEYLDKVPNRTDSSNQTITVQSGVIPPPAPINVAPPSGTQRSSIDQNDIDNAILQPIKRRVLR